MTMVAEEIYEGQTYRLDANGDTKTRVFKVSGATETEEAVSASGIPTIGSEYTRFGETPDDEGLRVANIAVEEMGRDDLHKVTVNYEYNAPKAGDEHWVLDMVTQTTNKQTCHSQKKYGAQARDVGKLVGVSDDGSVAGVDVYVPGGTLTITTWKDAEDVTMAYMAGCVRCSRKYNSVDWYGFSSGEALFVGPRITYTGQKLIEIEFTFLLQPNEDKDDLPTFDDWAGGTFQITDGKLGWQYMWLDQAERDDSGVQKLAVRGAYVSSVYKSSTFAALGLKGTY